VADIDGWVLLFMTNEETEIYEFLKGSPNQFVSVTDISKKVGSRKSFNADRLWAHPIVRRMEMEGWLECNPFGDYRLKHQPDETTSFKQALETPGVSLGDTTIIALSDRQDGQSEQNF